MNYISGRLVLFSVPNPNPYPKPYSYTPLIWYVYKWNRAAVDVTWSDYLLRTENNAGIIQTSVRRPLMTENIITNDSVAHEWTWTTVRTTCYFADELYVLCCSTSANIRGGEETASGFACLSERLYIWQLHWAWTTASRFCINFFRSINFVLLSLLLNFAASKVGITVCYYYVITAVCANFEAYARSLCGYILPCYAVVCEWCCVCSAVYCRT